MNEILFISILDNFGKHGQTILGMRSANVGRGEQCWSTKSLHMQRLCLTFDGSETKRTHHKCQFGRWTRLPIQCSIRRWQSGCKSSSLSRQ